MSKICDETVVSTASHALSGTRPEYRNADCSGDGIWGSLAFFSSGRRTVATHCARPAKAMSADPGGARFLFQHEPLSLHRDAQMRNS